MEKLVAPCPQCGSISYYAKRRFFNFCKGCRFGKCKYAEYSELYVYICTACEHCFEDQAIEVAKG